MSYFAQYDLCLIESLVYQPELKPGFECLKECLIWEDERPNGLSPEGYEKLCDLWIARSFLHKKVPFSSWELDPNYFEQVWSMAQAQAFKWPGFYRVQLNQEDALFYELERAKAEQGL